MTSTSDMPEALQALFRQWSKALAERSDDESRIAFFHAELPAFLTDRAGITDLLNRIHDGRQYPDTRQDQMFANEILLHLNASPMFSVRLYLFGRQEMTPVHDHNSWGVSGSACGNLRVIRYFREDDGRMEGEARLKPVEEFQLAPGEVETTRPRSIHRTGNAGGDATVMISIYGRPQRRLFIQEFDLTNERVYRIYPPQRRKKMLAQMALARMPEC